LDCDLAIIGGGPAGYVAAIYAAHLGARVVLIERDSLGGTCTNRGCIPTKALVSSVAALEQARRAADFGIEVGAVRADFTRIQARKDGIVTRLAGGINELMRLNKITVIKETGRILAPNKVKAGEETVSAGKIIIATGSRPARPPIPGLDTDGVIDTNGILALTRLPESLVVIGGGYVGCEFAGIMSGLGVKVTILELLPRLLTGVDDDITRYFLQTLKWRGVEVRTNTQVKAIGREGERLVVNWESAGAAGSSFGQHVLVATGRSPYFEGLSLEENGIKTGRRGVTVNEYLETSLSGVYAAGDVTGLTMLAHFASYQGEVAVENALGKPRKADNNVVPACIFVEPEIASVGLTERQVKETGTPCIVSRFPFGASGRAVAMEEATGTIKMVCGKDGKILGVQITGPHASDLIAEAALAMTLGATAADIARTIHAHPTLPEALRETALGQLSGQIHIKRAG